MKETSQNVASDIDLTTVHLEKLISDASSDRINIIEEENAYVHTQFLSPCLIKRFREDVEERTIVMQIRLTILLNEEIWSALDEENYSNAAQYYLLAQHIHTGLRLMTRNVLDEVPLLLRIKDTLDSLRARIIKGVNARLQTTELLTEVRTSCNLRLFDTHISFCNPHHYETVFSLGSKTIACVIESYCFISTSGGHFQRYRCHENDNKLICALVSLSW